MDSSAGSLMRKPSMAGSIMSMSGGQGGRKLLPEFEFSLGAAKVKVLKALEEGLPAPFVRFFSSPLFDRLLHALVLYFVALFQQDLLSHMADRSRAGHGESGNAQLLASKMVEVGEELQCRRSELSQPYCEIILKHSSYKNQQQDKRFFESLYAALGGVLGEAFERMGQPGVLDQELGRLFRGRHFNVAARVHGPQRSVDSLTVMQLWEVKHETRNRALHAQLISSLFEKAPTLSVKAAAVSNSSLVSQAVSSPLVSRALLADPLERDALLALPFSRTQHSRRAAGRHTGADANKLPSGLGALASRVVRADECGDKGGASSPRTTAAAAGVGTVPPGGGSPSVAAPSPGPTPAAAAAGLSPGPRASTIKPYQGVVAGLPEAVGVPLDERYAYLCLLRRCVLHGPTLGLNHGGPPNTAGRSGMLSLTGAACGPGSLSTSNSVAVRM